MASQNIIFSGESQSAKASPSTVRWLYPKLDFGGNEWRMALLIVGVLWAAVTPTRCLAQVQLPSVNLGETNFEDAFGGPGWLFQEFPEAYLAGELKDHPRTYAPWHRNSHRRNSVPNEDKRYDYIVVGAGAAGSVLAAELSASGARVVVIESGGPDDAPTVADPSVWFYKVGVPLDSHLPVNPSPRLNNREINMPLGHVVGGGSSINAMVWMRGM